MNFGQALELLKEGNLVQRHGWNGKGMWLVYVDGFYGHFVTVKEEKEVAILQSTIGAHPFIAMKTVENKLVPWLASQTDILAEDWQVIE